jgi:type II secretory pathway predicted ATPase ExeA
MYELYWGLKEKPFENTPDPRFLYFSDEHREAISRLTYAIEQRKGAALLTGGYGCGKTVISRQIFGKLTPDKYESALVTNPMLSPVALLREICFQLDVKIGLNSPKTQLLKKLNECFYENMNAQKDTVIIIDEAQAINSLSAFEELRLLLNFQLNDRFLLTLILIGQPELRAKINQLKQFKQRLAIQYHLAPLNEQETTQYILHRLEVAEAQSEIFAPDAIQTVWKRSNGIPRVINNICDLSLLIGFSNKVHKIDEALIQSVANEIDQ